MQILKSLQGRFARGRFDVTVLEEATDEQPCALRLNRPLAHAYLDAVKTLQSELGLAGSVTLELLLSRSDLFETDGEEPGDGRQRLADGGDRAGGRDERPCRDASEGGGGARGRPARSPGSG
ncbi:MAG: hypothetical protein M5R38_12785 [Candidatus Methylomirabilis sp.]|nr:hypothetical protein [Candidatus Methylomirabilis sp.]